MDLTKYGRSLGHNRVVSSHDLIIAEIPRLRRYARALTGNPSFADDLVQDTLERALGKWRLWQREKDLRPWLFSIMHNLHVDGVRRNHRLDYCDDAELATVAQRSTQNDALEIRDLERALFQIPLDQREVLLLVALEEMTYAEVAKALAIPVGTVMSRLSRGRSLLKERLHSETNVQLKVVAL